VDGEQLGVAISAAIRAIDPIQEWQRGVGDYWATAEEPARVKIKFEVDAATRVAMFGTPFPDLQRGVSSDAAPVRLTSTAGLRLIDAPVSLGGRTFGYAKNDVWIGIFESESPAPSLVLDRYGQQQRYANGFLADDYNPIWPRLWLAGWNLSQMIELLLGGGRGARIELRDGYFGHWEEWHEEMQSIELAQIEIRLIDCGLEISYDVTLEGNEKPEDARGKFTLPWELLLLRYPRVGHLNPRASKHRSRVIR